MKTMKKFLSLLVGISMIMSISTIAFAESTSIWRISGATENATIVYSEAYAYEGVNSAHIKYEDGAGTTLKLYPAIADNQYKLVSMAGGDIWETVFSFYAKGTLPETANVTYGFTNGSRILLNCDVADWEIGEADENGWYKVSMMGQESNWQGAAGGNISMPVISITSSCDFFMDDVKVTFKTYDADWNDKIAKFEVLEGLDTGFENETATEFAAVLPADPIWKVSGTTEAASIVFSEAYAYEGTKAAHVKYEDGAEATLMLYPAIADNQYKLVNMAGGDIWQTDFSFYAKGTLPATATVKSTFTNGTRTLLSCDTSKWTIGEADENGWYKVSMFTQAPNWQGAAGGNIGMPVITITSACDFFIDNIEMTFKTWDSGWNTKLETFSVLEGLDAGFENETATELEYNFDEGGTEPEPETPAADPIWKISGTTDTASIVFSEAHVYAGKNAAHIKYEDGAEATLMLYPAIADDQYKLVNMAGSDIWETVFSFYAKGTLPETANVTYGFANGTRTLLNCDTSKWTIGETDENGWYKVSMMGQESNWQGPAGGNISMPVIKITSACDFFIDNIEMTFKTYDSGWGSKIAKFSVMEELDTGFENETATEFEYELGEVEEVVPPIWKISGQTDKATAVFSTANAYDGEKSLHIKYADEDNLAKLTVYMGLQDKDYTLVNWANGDIYQTTVTFYAKGILPESASVKMTLTNGFRTLVNADVSKWTVSEADENGWYKVSMLGQYPEWQGASGGNISSPYIYIDGACDFYIDNVVVDFKTYDSNWATKIASFDPFAELDCSFENEIATESNVEEPDAIEGMRFDIVDFGENEFSKLGENAEVLYENIDWLEPGYYMASADIVNSTGEDEMFVTALYKNGALADCVVITVPAASGKKVTYKAVLEIPDMEETDEYEVKAFVWDGGMNPMSAPVGIR